MRFGKRLLAALMALMIGWLGDASIASLVVMSGYAEDVNRPELELVATALPDAPGVSDEVELTFTIANRSDATLFDLRLTAPDGTQTEPLGSLAPSESLSHTLVHTVIQAELDEGAISYMLTCEADGVHCSYPISASIQQYSSVPEIAAIRLYISIFRLSFRI